MLEANFQPVPPGAVTVQAAPLAEAGEDTLDVVGLDVGELLFRTDSDDGR